MTRDEITRMAREAGFVGMDGLHKGLCRFAALVAAAEREACAEVCQGVVDGGQYDGWQQYAAAACRDEIRARGEKGQS
jgi:hypothetical protein